MSAAGRGLRIALAGATGALGEEIVAVLAERRVPLASFHPFATESSLGAEVEINDEGYAVADEPPRWADCDLLIVACPAEPGRELVREALRASVACIDCSGAMLAEEAVPVALPELGSVPEAVSAPVCALPPGPALGWAYALAPLREASNLVGVHAVVLSGVSHAGGRAMEILSEQTIAALNSQDPGEQDRLPGAVAFDALPQVGTPVGTAGATDAEEAWALGLRRALADPTLPVAITATRVPAFVGDGAALQLRFEKPLSVADALDRLASAPGVAIWSPESAEGAPIGPSLRDGAGHDQVLVARVRPDPTDPCGLLLWTTSDSLRLCAGTAVRLAELRVTVN